MLLEEGMFIYHRPISIFTVHCQRSIEDFSVSLSCVIIPLDLKGASNSLEAVTEQCVSVRRDHR